ncbi:MAG: alpha-ribazole phosphatase family protein [Sulfuricaulis sp.]|uniref:alpha-ribazole phosphatase family protein n=1 Tax=Sulfuricaulis sp. TaxID=2003553 RepID=UPI0025FAFFA5|nr:alpha-ribazole phosphatase family protein [Sulfuricaulis sp.]MCR4346815.1 alpha-ribazole phosphatase family protein [Sulfuricaulis sp.]
MTQAVSTLFDLLRHGEPVGGRKYRGQLDDPLSERGWRQMREAVGEHCPWDVILSSPLSRCAAFARELAIRHDLPLEIETRFMELGFGEWEGRTATELLERDPQLLTRFWQDPVNHAPPGGETLATFRNRIKDAFDEALSRHEGRHVLLVCHAGVIRLLVSHALDMPLDRMFRIDVPSAGISRIRIDANGTGPLPRLVFHAGRL